MRAACGSNDHPDPITFIQVFRLMSCYSLVKTPRGSNVCSSELLQTLVNTKDSINSQKEKKSVLFKKIQDMLENGTVGNEDQEFNQEENIDIDSLSFECCEQNNLPEKSLCSHLQNHDYDIASTNQYILSYIAGFVVHKIKKFTNCTECINTLTTNVVSDQHQFIKLIDEGSLQYPSLPLEKLIEQLEQATLRVAGQLQIKSNTLFQIVDEASRLESVVLIGCLHHSQDLTLKINNYYLITRSCFLAKSYNKNNDHRKQKTKTLRKSCKF